CSVAPRSSPCPASRRGCCSASSRRRCWAAHGSYRGASWRAAMSLATRSSSRHSGTCSAARPLPPELARDDRQVFHERVHRLLALIRVTAEDRGGMHRRRHPLREWRLDELPPLPADAELTTEKRLGGRRAEAHEHPRPDRGKLALQPGTAGVDLPEVGL